ncbi:MAG: hypothetical protein A2051_04140 [Desulfovibrionales bacterium GWA2_65_9]|nr:MAG: hypothetical protein A2051_04140 [Desulfovibrionales bacterium GWA2_65_9]
MSILVLAALACAFGSIAVASNAVAADDVTNVVVGDWKTGKASRNSVVIDGEKIYLDGVLQEQKYRPGMDVIVRDGKAAVVPHDASRDAEKAAAKAAAKAERERDKEALKAQARAEKEALKAAAKAEARAEKEAIQREAAAGLEKGKIKTSTGRVVNKGGAVRIGNKDYPSTGPATEQDIPPDARKAIEDAKRLGQ